MAGPTEGTVVDGYKFKGGDPNSQSSWEAVQQPAAPGGPKVGDVVDGYRFKGGNPQEQTSWEQAQSETDRTLGGALGEAAGNLIPSVGKNIGQLAEGVGSMVMHPIDTAKTMGKLAFSISPLMPALKAAAGLSGSRELNDWLNDMDAPKQALIEDYAKAYGGWQPFLKTLATDPGRVMTDIATIATGGEAAAAKLPQLAGTLAKAGKIGATTAKVLEKTGSVAETLARGAQYADPLNAALKTAGLAGQGAGKILTAKGSVLTGTGMMPLEEAYKAGRAGGQDLDLLKGGMRGDITADDVFNTAKQGMQNIRTNRMADYNAKMANAGLSNVIPNAFTSIDQAVTDAESMLKSKGGVWKISDADKSKWQGVLDKIDEVRSNPGSHTVEELDDLKQAIRNQISWQDKTPVLRKAVTQVANAALDAAKSGARPEYSEGLKGYFDTSKLIGTIEDDLALGNSKPATAVTRLQSALRNNAYSQQGKRLSSLQALEREGNVRLIPQLAGMALNPSEPRGLARAGMHGLPWVGALTHGPLGFVAGHLLEQTLGSPRNWGRLYTGAGRAAGLPGQLYDRLPSQLRDVLSTTGQAVTSQPARNLYQGLDRTGGFAHGGRVGYADGGMLGDDSDFSDASMPMPLPALRGAVNTTLPQLQAPKVVDPLQTILSRQIGPSRLVQPTGPTATPQLPSIQQPKTDTSSVDAIKSAADQWNKSVKGQDDDELTKTIKAIKEQIAKTAGGAPAGAPATSPAGGDAPDAVPLKGDTYEDKVALRESGGKPFAINDSGAAGLYQFMPATAEGIRKAHPELGISDRWRFNVDDQKKLMKVFTDENRDTLRSTLKRDPTGGELYLAHFLGAGGAQRFLGGLNQPIDQITTQAERSANPFVSKFKTGQDMLNYFNKLFG